MKHKTRWFNGGVFFTAFVMSFASGCLPPGVFRSRPQIETRVQSVRYHGWTNALRLWNDQAEVIVVPEIGRVMSFRLRGGDNVFWEDCSLDGRRGDATGKEWVNFGGDKTWPAPEAEWSRYTKHKQWMPPTGFDGLLTMARVEGDHVVTISSIDPFYGIRTTRRIGLNGTTMEIVTTYERISGEPSKIGIWVITQFKEPVAVYSLIEWKSIFADGHFKFGNEPWPQLRRKDQHLEITRDPKVPHKMGSDTHRLMWVGAKEVCLVSTSREPGAEYADRGASAEVYTNPDPKKYIEIEMLGPLALMKPGDKISHANTYLLRKRTDKNPEAELSWMAW